YKGSNDLPVEKDINDDLKFRFEKSGFLVTGSDEPDRKERIRTAKDQEALYYFEGFYKSSADKNSLTIYGQLYNPETGFLVDSIQYSSEVSESLGAEMRSLQDKYREPKKSVITKFSDLAILSVTTNPRRTEIRENIYDNLLSLPIGKDFKFPVATEDSAKISAEIFKSLGDTEVVTASRKSQKISEAPAKVIAINSETIHNRGYRTLTELLKDVPGFDFNSFNDSGEYPTDLLLRGIGDVGQTQILIMENGIIQNDIGNGWLRQVGFENTLIDVERVEIILGPGSALYGANAYAGLINVITKKGTQFFTGKKQSGFATETRMMGGSNNTKMPETLSTYSFESGVTLQLAARYYQTSGDGGANRPDPGNYFHNNREPDKVTTREYGTINNDRLPGKVRKPRPDGFNDSAKDIFLRGRMFYKNFTLGFNYWDQKEGLGSYVPGYEYFANTKNIPYQKHHQGYFLYTSYDMEITKNFTSMTKVYIRNTSILPDTGFEYTYRYQSVDNAFIGSRQVPPVADKEKQYHGQSYLTGIQQQFNQRIANGNELVYGLQIDKTQRTSSSDNGGGVSLGKRQSTNSNVIVSRWEDQTSGAATVFYSTNAAFYIQDEQKFLGNKYGFTAGVRHDTDTDYGNVWAPRTGLVGNPFEKINFKLLYGEAYKAPTVFQIYDEFRGNLSLQPQKIRTSEVEVTYSPKQSITFKGGYFISQLENLIAEAPNPSDGKYVIGAAGQHATYFQNFKPTHIFGTIIEIDANILRDLNFYVNYTFTEGRDRKTPYDFTANQSGVLTNVTTVTSGKELDNIAAKKLNAGINYFLLNKLNINLRMNWTGKRKAPSTNTYYNPYDYNFTGSKNGYPYVTEGTPDGYLSGYTIYNLTLTLKNFFGFANIEPQLMVLNLLNTSYVGMGRQSGNAQRPVDSIQPTIQNPNGFVSPYHPQPGREIYFQLTYRY
ncbi:MAG: TonB-dependent receptor plug domain-containing protein, partial [Leptospira sp.]|nr:TonB-dependent receptor plug domain-containing protein [Leptospira sp.]